MARGGGLPLPTVFTLHSAFAGVCGALALLVPAFFGQVFPDLASPVGRPVAASATQPAAAARAAETNLSEPPDAASSIVPSASHVESVGLSFDTI